MRARPAILLAATATALTLALALSACGGSAEGRAKSPGGSIDQH